ncbi:hypothetical protein CDAR_527431 [Caerostris darwini]|uniref:Uncharacterized protein n=1 Tax=Caerostris darwini TaxID=1538125 RepID=A0AAV4WJ97_9ARAC|nr:hypothetical protein CDAR_527431 [Caerostris darwini]
MDNPGVANGPEVPQPASLNEIEIEIPSSRCAFASNSLESDSEERITLPQVWEGSLEMQVSWNEWLRESGVRNAGYGNRVNGALTGPFLGILLKRGARVVKREDKGLSPLAPRRPIGLPQDLSSFYIDCQTLEPKRRVTNCTPLVVAETPSNIQQGERRVPHGGEGPIWTEGERRGRSSLAMGSCAQALRDSPPLQARGWVEGRSAPQKSSLISFVDESGDKWR